MEEISWSWLFTGVGFPALIGAAVSATYNAFIVEKQAKAAFKRAGSVAVLRAVETLEDFALAQPPHLSDLGDAIDEARHGAPTGGLAQFSVPKVDFPDSIRWETIPGHTAAQIRSVLAIQGEFDREIAADARAGDESMGADGYAELVFQYTRKMTVEAWVTARAVRDDYHMPRWRTNDRELAAIERVIDSAEKHDFWVADQKAQRNLKEAARLHQRRREQSVAD